MSRSMVHGYLDGRVPHEAAGFALAWGISGCSRDVIFRPTSRSRPMRRIHERDICEAQSFAQPLGAVFISEELAEALHPHPANRPRSPVLRGRSPVPPPAPSPDANPPNETYRSVLFSYVFAAMN